ncbi:ScbA/BarX family gamma-butyrolactone biosynthesis protein [Streptomyces alanosinicus]|uniref:Adhesin n=1 Tax=Streptomyces alanosinicus TaxID=68171 RepID=A0A919D6S4_9ACTN|nr:ScbA/BarX family gamma-butyrolactone biosynthesis protein [Streptomyces alanosinicus]GHE12702.1 adhesin [Streptomyces alanosinicus]
MHRTVLLRSQSAPAIAADRIPGRLVHKRNPDEILLASYLQLENEEFLIDAAWPTHHAFYQPRHGFFDPLLAIESVRQSVPLISHAGYGAALDNRQSWLFLRYALDARALYMTARDKETAVQMHVACSQGARRSSRLGALSMSVSLRRGDIKIGSVQTSVHNYSAALYRRVRGAYADLETSVSRALPLAPPAPPRTVGRAGYDDVVLSPTDTPLHSQLRVDLGHPILFDHPVDHVPGMLLLEAARQAAHVATMPCPMLPVAMDAAFTRFVELDAPCWIHIDPLPDDARGRVRLLVSALQRETLAFSSVVTLEPVPGI